MAVESEPPAGSEVLLLEDDSILRRRLAAHLRKLGAEVVEAVDLGEAKRALAEFRFDFALVDLHLPDGDALELLREGAFSENTGVVVMTAFGGIKEAVEAMRRGAGDYLTKPFEPDELPIAFMRCREKRGVARRDEFRLAEQAMGGRDDLFFGESLAGSAASWTRSLRRSAAWRGTCRRCSSRARPARERASSRRGCTATGPGPPSPSSR
jgi:DNA-binding NtrC family response regulator